MECEADTLQADSMPDCEAVYAGAETHRLMLASKEGSMPFCQVLQAQELRAAVTLS